ncbi:MAG: hypothetical protein NTX59_02820 [Elusimicrobia bacterium]|nr:hypothetical protein [Elusimicrobiota bacterium]
MAQAIKTLCGAVKAAALFIVRRPKDAAFVICGFLFVFILMELRHEQSHVRELTAKTEGLPPGTKEEVVVYRDRIIEKWRTGPAQVEYRERYLPPEGHVEIVTKENAPNKPPEVVVKDWGFAMRLGGGVVYSDRILPMLDLKWFYWKRYSLTVGITPKFGGLCLSRHIDDFTPFCNLEIFSIVGITWQGNRDVGMGVRINF